MSFDVVHQLNGLDDVPKQLLPPQSYVVRVANKPNPEIYIPSINLFQGKKTCYIQQQWPL